MAKVELSDGERVNRQNRLERLTEVSSAHLIKGVRAVDEEIEKLKARFEQDCRPFQMTREELVAALAIKLDRDGQTSCPTRYGTAYFSNLISVKVTDRETWFGWIVANGAYDCLTSHISKEDLKKRGYDHAGEFDEIGVKITEIRNLNIRKA